jgi:hypothetical protein
MSNPILKVLLSAVVIVAVAEISKRSSFWGGLLASLPLTSLLAFIWLYQDTHEVQKVADLSWSIFWLVLPSLVLFVVLPVLLKRGVGFHPALGFSVLAMLAAYGATVLVLRQFHIKL